MFIATKAVQEVMMAHGLRLCPQQSGDGRFNGFESLSFASFATCESAGLTCLPGNSTCPAQWVL